MLKKWFNYIILFLILVGSVNALVISEVMFNPISSDAYNEWIEVYNDDNVSVDISSLILCNDTISEGYSNTSYDVTNKRGYDIIPGEFFIITDNGSNVTNNFNISNKTKFFHTSKRELCLRGLNNGGENISLNLYNETIVFDYTYFGSMNAGFAPYYDFEKNDYSFGCIENGTPGHYFQCNETNNNNPKGNELTYDFRLSNNTIKNNETLFFLGQINNPYNITKANLTIKIGIKNNKGGYTYPEELVVFNKEIILKSGFNNLSELTNNAFWSNELSLLSGEYKAYSRLLSEVFDKRPYETFFLYSKANVFLDGFSISNQTILLNETVIFGFNISNYENKNFNVSYGFKIKKFKTLKQGLIDYQYICNNTEIFAGKNEEFFCSWSKNDFISNNESFYVYPFIIFDYENNSVLREANRQKVVFVGLEDIGEPDFDILNSPSSVSFGRFSNVLINYSSNNYDQKVRFLVYGYPSQILCDYDFSSLSASNALSSTSVELNIFRGLNYFVSIPFLLKPNCDDYYAYDNYRVRLRAFKKIGDSWVDFLTKDFYIDVDEKNSALCPVTKSSSSNQKSGGLVNVAYSGEKNFFTYSDTYFRINISENINSNSFFVVVNSTNKKELGNFTIESYLFSGRKRYSKNNKISFSLEENQSKEIILENIINQELVFGKVYKVMVKINSSKRKSVKSYSKEVIISINDEKNSIKSFYTLQKNYDEGIIRLYASPTKQGGELVLMSSFGEQKKLGEEKVVFEEKIFPGINNYFLLLKENNKTVDVKELLIFANQTKIVVLENLKENLFVGTQILETDNGLKIIGKAITPITYDLGSDKLKRLIKYLVIFLFVSVGTFWFWRRSF
ncbi:lamin tail domain-containing protein [Candidatus Woesearchaeota archaeon]|nr:lamin tail domain-containing protein [Candidatus Woesearchaeota archaeon]